jgi:fructosamine-3-kinase
MADGYRFFAEHRLGYQAQRAARRGLLDAPLEAAVQALCRRLPELIPTQQPALLHGDLWSGNHFAAADGGPVLVDPACHWGWPEAELAMMCLFGQAPDRFFSAYTEHRPLAPGWAQRQPLYNLYHLLNHLVLFGTGYLNPVAAILRPFARPGRRR